MRKRRVLWSNEASYLSTGYSTYGLEVLKRLHATGKYELAELASYGDAADPRGRGTPWRFYPNMPDRDNQQEVAAYESNPLNQFGAFKFEQVALDFRPDVVMDVRDWWMLEHQERSPFRPYFHHAIMPTVDAAPQDDQWMATFMGADAVFAYSDWGLDVLKGQSCGRVRTKCSAPPGADLEAMRPVPDRAAHKRSMGVDPDALVVGTVMRNQRRKLYPDLVEAFALFLREGPPDLTRRTYLYMHTSWPDMGWDIPRLVTEAGVGHRCLFTYACRSCGAVYPSHFADVRAACRKCGAHTAGFPNTHNGISRADLGRVMNLFDAYVQYANSEGFGMPQVEAAACGVPVMAVDYSAMSDVVRKVGGVPIPVQRLCRESETHCWRALPDNAAFASLLTGLLSKPEPVRRRMGYEARKAVEERYTYDRTAKVWEDHLDSVDVSDRWLAPPRIHTPAERAPQGLSDEDFVRWGMVHVAGRPELVNSYTAVRMARDLNWESSLPSMGGLYFNEASTLGVQVKYRPFHREDALHELRALGEQKNFWERRRAGV